MNPIDKITDSSFTNSSKGLMTLFCIGLAHIVLGVNLDGNDIAIPWIPTINIPNTDRLVYLYWALVGFTMYRYFLHHLPLMRKFYFQAQYQFLKSTQRGQSFINEMIFDIGNKYDITLIENKDTAPAIEITHKYESEEENPTNGKPKVDTAIFKFIYTKAYHFEKIEYTEYHEISSNEDLFKNWGFEEEYPVDENHFGYDSFQIKNRHLKNKLHMKVFRVYINLIFSSKDTFDILTPLILNSLLLLYCVLTKAVSL